MRINVCGLATLMATPSRSSVSVFLHIVIGHVGGRVVRQHGQGALHPHHVLRRVVDQQIDVLGEAPRAVSDHGETADQQVARAGLVQRPADAGDVGGLRRPCVATIIRLIHASASSKDLKRNTPRGTSAALPRKNTAVRDKRPWSAQASPSSARCPTLIMLDHPISRTSAATGAGSCYRFSRPVAPVRLGPG